MKKITVNVPIELYQEDWGKIILMLAKDSINLQTLLTGFIADLVSSTKSSNGSDERILADEYYERCWYGLNGEGTFLRYLVEKSELFSFLEWLKDVEIYQDEEAKGVLNDYYEEYIEEEKKPQSKETAFKAIYDWYKENKKIFEQL